MFISQETIFALATPPGKSGVAVLRISGSRAFEALPQLGIHALPAARVAVLKKLKNLSLDEVIDEALVICFPAPYSFTGENIVELCLHGSPAIIKEIVQILGSLPNFRLAEPGEFTKRAFLNEKLDLTQVEGLADLIEAETKFQHRQALRQMQGALGDFYGHIRSEIIQIMAWVEAYIDFPDEDIPLSLVQDIEKKVALLLHTIEHHLQDERRGEKLRQGLSIAIMGVPNVGKSSLLNCLIQREMAIVTAIPGTTRDILETTLDIGGYPFILADTAGIRDTTDTVEAIGVERARNYRNTADIILLVLAPDVPIEAQKKLLNELNPLETQAILVVNKADFPKANELYESLSEQPFRRCLISTITEQGIKALNDYLIEIAELSLKPGVDASITRERYRIHLTRAKKALQSFDLRLPLELAAEELRIAITEIGKLTGRVDVEALLDVIFQQFCIGK